MFFICMWHSFVVYACESNPYLRVIASNTDVEVVASIADKGAMVTTDDKEVLSHKVENDIAHQYVTASEVSKVSYLN